MKPGRGKENRDNIKLTAAKRTNSDRTGDHYPNSVESDGVNCGPHLLTLELLAWKICPEPNHTTHGVLSKHYSYLVYTICFQFYILRRKCQRKINCFLFGLINNKFGPHLSCINSQI